MNLYEKLSIVVCILSVFLLSSSMSLEASNERPTVFRSLQFGDTKKEARLKILRDDSFSVPMVSHGSEALSPEGTVDLQIDSTQLNLLFFFNKEGLYRLDASGMVVSGDQFESTLMDRVKTLRSVAKVRFGEPSFTKRQDRDDVGSGEFKMMAYWSAEDLDGEREIWVGATGTKNGFKPSLIIQNPTRSKAGSIDSDSSQSDYPNFTVDKASNLF